MKPCPVCGIWGEMEHDHKPIGTLSPEEASVYWMERANAAVSGQ